MLFQTNTRYASLKKDCTVLQKKFHYSFVMNFENVEKRMSNFPPVYSERLGTVSKVSINFENLIKF